MADPAQEVERHELVGSETNGTGYPALRREVQEVRLYAALGTLWASRRRFLLAVAVFLGLALVYILGSRNEYTTAATLMPEQQSESPNIAGLDLLQDFGGLLGGLSPGSLLQKQNALPVQIYPEILKSTPILVELLKQPVPVENRTVSLQNYLMHEAPFSLWESSSRVVGNLVAAIRPARTPVRLADSTVIYLSRDELRVVEDLRDRLTADLDKKTGILSVSATMPDPVVAAAVGNAAVAALTVYITRYRLHKLEQDLEFISGRYEDAKIRFNVALDGLAKFQDRNQNISRNLARTEGQRLQAEYDLAFSVYSSLATKLEEAKIKVQEETPVFQVLQPVSVPLRKSHPKSLPILFLALMAGAVTGSTLILSGFDGRRMKATFASA